MHTKFIHILLSVMAAGWMFASCSSDALNDETVASGSEVQFATAEVSRAAVSTTLNYAGSKFAIFGDMKFGGASSPAQNVVVFNGIPVSYDGAKWTYANTQYWFPKHEHSFVALHPISPTGVTSTSYADNSLSFNYTHPDAFRDMQDLLVATHRRMYEGGAAPTVMLRFVHALSRVNFLVKCDGAAEKVVVKEIRLEGIKKSGTLTVVPAPLTSDSKQTDDYNLFWTNSQNTETLVADLDVEVEDGSERPLFPDNDALLVIPQPENEGIIMRITYTLIYTNGKTEEQTLPATTPIGGWKPGKIYTYSLSFIAETKEIEMNVSVNDWKVGPIIDDVQVPRK